MIVRSSDGRQLGIASECEFAHSRTSSWPVADAHDVNVVGLEPTMCLLAHKAPRLLTEDWRSDLAVVNARNSLKKSVCVCAVIQLLLPHNPSLIGRDVSLDRIQGRKHARRYQQLCCGSVGRDDPQAPLGTLLLI